ncbi:MAG: hypothetical protein IJ113_03435 [Eggerthellaceae bacterium]|nr:hypothetical protein [Eggerthellaceae bacterium]
MVVKSERLSLTKYEAENLIREAWTGSMSVPVSDLTTLRLMARALGERTYKEWFAGVAWWAFDYEGVHLFCRSGEVA